MDLRAFALVAGGLGALANLLLIAFYVDLAVGSNIGVDLGYANDVAMVPYSLALIPVVAGVFLRASPMRAGDVAVLVLGLSSATVLMVAQLLLILRTVTFDQQIGYAATASFLVIVWVIIAQWRAGNRLAHSTRRWGLVVAIALPVALLLLGIGMWNTYSFWAGIAVGGVAWCSVAGWLLTLGERRTR